MAHITFLVVMVIVSTEKTKFMYQFSKNVLQLEKANMEEEKYEDSIDNCRQ